MWVRVAAWVVLAASAAGAGSAREELVALRARLAARRLLDRTSGWTALLQFAQAHRNDPALAAEVMYQVGFSQRQSRSQLAQKALEGLLESFPDEQPWAARATLDLAGIYAEHSSSQSKAVELYEKSLQLETGRTARRAAALAGLASCLQERGKNAEALAAYRRLLEEFPQDARRCANALGAVGALQVRLNQPQEAWQTCQKLSADYPWEADQRADLLLSVAQGFRTSEQPDMARKAYESLLDDLPAAGSRRTYAYRGLAMLHLQQRDTEAAVETYRRMAEDRSLDPSYRVQAYSQLFELFGKADDYPAMTRLAYELIAAHPTRVLVSGRIFDELVDALLHEGRLEEALAMAKAYFRLSQLPTARGSSHSSTTQSAILTVVRALKGMEGGLRSANAFLAFLQSGPEGPDGRAGTADDIEDPLAKYRLPKNEERDRLFGEAEQRLRPDPLQLGYLYVCCDRPTDALRAFRRAYLQARTQSQVQAAATRVARAMRAFGRPEAEVDAFFDFQNFGSHGKDGKPNTADDLKDPILERK